MAALQSPLHADRWTQRKETAFMKAKLAMKLLLGLMASGCAGFNSNMSSLPERSAVPPYADDPEANGNPAKAWYN